MLALAVSTSAAAAFERLSPAAGGVLLVKAKSEATEKKRTRAVPKPPTMDELFQRLKQAKDDETAQGLQNRIIRRWMHSGSATVDLLMSWAAQSIAKKDYDTALELLDRIIAMKPDYAEAWNKTATIHFMRQEYGPSLDGIRRTLELEPRHFGALAGLGMIFQQLDDKPAALEAFQKALAINPRMAGPLKAVETLSKELEGQDI